MSETLPMRLPDDFNTLGSTKYPVEAVYAKKYADENGNDILSTIKSTVSELKTSVINSIYPIGSIYITTSSVNPAKTFGVGSWSQITGRFLLSASNTYLAGNSGGEATHTLTVNEMPKHTHNGAIEEAGAHTHTAITSGSSSNKPSSSSGTSSYISRLSSGTTNEAGKHTHTVTLAETGADVAHNNMPPYYVVYMWQRVS